MNLLMKKLGVKLTKEEVDCLMDCTDEDQDVCLNFTDFVNMYRFLLPCKGNGFNDVNVREAFDLSYKNGWIDLPFRYSKPFARFGFD
ncbi:hypothetical protein SUGI_0096720 [Cryptomeria japonica]|nr:hypothetical protein SUGI_0096720 [Cryptomeria japonica]